MMRQILLFFYKNSLDDLLRKRELNSVELFLDFKLPQSKCDSVAFEKKIDCGF